MTDESKPLKILTQRYARWGGTACRVPPMEKAIVEFIDASGATVAWAWAIHSSKNLITKGDLASTIWKLEKLGWKVEPMPPEPGKKDKGKSLNVDDWMEAAKEAALKLEGA